MKERPILFKGPMVRAILEGRKTQTRRIFYVKDPMGVKRAITSPDEEIIQFNDGTFNYSSTGGLSGPYVCRYGGPGCHLWVRERGWIAQSKQAFIPFLGNERSGLPKSPDGTPYKACPSIHMPRWASRITLEIVNIRVERLQEISEEDAKAEGCDPIGGENNLERYRSGFYHLWDSINGKAYPCDSNPWAWVIEFRRVPCS